MSSMNKKKKQETLEKEELQLLSKMVNTLLIYFNYLIINKLYLLII